MEAERPAAVFLAGDLAHSASFVDRFLRPGFLALRSADYAPQVFIVPGNEDPASAVPAYQRGQAEGAWRWLQSQSASLGRWRVHGYGCVPPTPFTRKDWERHDLRPGAGLPTRRSIRQELAEQLQGEDLQHAVLLLHTPPYGALDDAGLHGRDPHVGSHALRELIERRQPWLTLHGHVHGTARRTGRWMERWGRTVMLSGTHDGPELALVRFELEAPWEARRELVSP